MLFFRTGSWVIHMVLAGDLVPTCTLLMTLGIE